jgi:hypothetical protein
VSSYDKEVRKKFVKDLGKYFSIVEPTFPPKGKITNVASVLSLVKKDIRKSQYVIGYFSGKGALPITVANEVALGRALGKRVIVVSPKSARKRMNPFFRRVSERAYDSTHSFIKSMEPIERR